MTRPRRPGAFWIFVALVAFGVLRIALTYRAVAQTVDETPNIACGMQWLDQGRYDMGPFHPPLARIAMAAGPYLYGLRSQGLADRWKEGNAILHSRKKYAVALTLARIGILPFFILAAGCVWLWSRRILGELGGLAAVFVFTNLPIVLAHSGLATTDMAVAAGVVFALYRFSRWLDQPNARNSAWLGVAAATALLAKFSAFLAVPLCAFAILSLYLISKRRLPPVRARMIAIAAVVAFLVIWAGYRFSVGRMREPLESGLAGSSRFWNAVSRLPVPAPLLGDGLLLVRVLNRDGHPAYLLGELRQTGWWYFFPIALGVKTPLAVLILAAIGLLAAVPSKLRWQAWAPGACCLAILAACLPSHLNTGLRYLLCLFPMLSIVAAQGAMWLWERTARRPIAIVLALWLAFVSLRAHPDYIPYFNELAGNHPERILVDSDLDWGQDMKRLVWKLHELRVDHVYCALLWSGDDSKIGLPPWDGLEAYQPVKGWVAISYTEFKTQGLVLARSMGRRDSAYGWLERYQPAYRVGKSILLYHIPN
jgi:4-amino-4-deoxy-L-arabinose transferase-like glycosyltransferase